MRNYYIWIKKLFVSFTDIKILIEVHTMLPTCDIQGNEALVSCHRTPFFDHNQNPVGVLTHTFLIQNKEALELSNILSKQEPENKLGYHMVR